MAKADIVPDRPRLGQLGARRPSLSYAHAPDDPGRERGTHQGEFNGIPATGKKVSIEMMDRVRTRDGKAVEHWGCSDDLGMMTQLGVIPEMG